MLFETGGYFCAYFEIEYQPFIEVYQHIAIDRALRCVMCSLQLLADF